MEKGLFVFIKNNPRESENTIREFFELMHEKGINNEYTYSLYFSLYKADTTSNKNIFNEVINANIGVNHVYPVGKAILEDKLILKLMDDDIPGTTVPKIIDNFYQIYSKGASLSTVLNAEFYYIIIPRLPISVIKTLSEEKFSLLSADDQYQIYEMILELLMDREVNTDNIRFMVNHLMDESSNYHQITLNELVD